MISKNGIYAALVFLLILGPLSASAYEYTFDSLISACYQGDAYEAACSAVDEALLEATVPSGVSIGCVWNPNSEHSCTARVLLDATSIVDTMTQSSLIKSMEFIQSGVVTNNITFYSEPFIPHRVHVTADGSLFPTAADPEFWMEVTSVSNFTIQAFSFTSMNPANIASEQLADIESQYLGNDNITIGMGITPDLSEIKTFEEFDWNLTLSYETEQYLIGIAACNGSFDGSSCDENWISLEECQTPGSCPDDTYLKDVPAAGFLTVYGADPVPVYGYLNETACNLVGDEPPCDEITLSEVIDLITLWAADGADLSDVIDLINAWASG